MSQRPRKPGGARRTPSRRGTSVQGRAAGADSGGLPGAATLALLFGGPVVLIVLALVFLGGKERTEAPPPAPKVDVYKKAKRLEHEAEPHITRLFRAKRAGDKAKVQAEFKLAQEKLLAAKDLLEELKMKYTDDKTLDGNLPPGFSYLDDDLQKLTVKHIQIIKEVEY